jgi:phenylalanyl-tRNA synthetase beta chain
LRVERTNRLLGLSLSPAEVVRQLARVGVVAAEQGAGVLVCDVPSHRNDLTVHQDLSEEVARMVGYENIPITLPTAQLVPARIPDRHRIADRARDLLAGAGTGRGGELSVHRRAELAALRLADDDPAPDALRLRNPIQDAERLLRTTLLPSLLRLVRQNLSRQVPAVGPVRGWRACSVRFRARRAGRARRAFRASRSGRPPCSPRPATRSSGRAATAPRPSSGPRESRKKLCPGWVIWHRCEVGPHLPYLHPARSLALWVGDQEVGHVGELHPAVRADLGIEPAARCSS